MESLENTTNRAPEKLLSRSERLLEEFLEVCRDAFRRESGRPIRDFLRDRRGWRAEVLADTMVGLYPRTRDVLKCLLDRGFTREEIAASSVCGDPRLEGRLILPWRDQSGRTKTVVAIPLLPSGEPERRPLFPRGAQRPEFYGLDVALSGAVPRHHLLIVDDLLDVVYLQAIGITNVVATGTGPISSRQLQFLAERGLESLTYLAGSRESASRWARTAMAEVHRAESSPAVFVVSTDALGEACTVSSYFNRQGAAAAEDLLERKVHGYTVVARDLARMSAREHTVWDDRALEIIHAAARFDAQALQPERDQELERYFWPEVLTCLGTDWNALQQRFARRIEPVVRALRRQRVRRFYAGLSRDLQQALRAGDIERFEAILVDACRLFGVAEARWETTEGANCPNSGNGESASEDPWRHVSRRPCRDFVTYWEERFGTKNPSPPVDSAEPAKPYAEETSARREPPPPDRPTSLDIRRLAYQLWEQSGRPQGWDQHFWHTAESYLRSGRTT